MMPLRAPRTTLRRLRMRAGRSRNLMFLLMPKMTRHNTRILPPHHNQAITIPPEDYIED